MTVRSETATSARASDGQRAIAFILVGVFCISVNDMVIKLLSGDYPLHQMVFIRSAIAMLFTLVFLRLEGGWALLITRHPILHGLRVVLIVAANLTFFVGLAVLDLGTATALFFVAPLFITLLSIPVLGEHVGPRRLGAVCVGFLGVLLIVLTGSDAAAGDIAEAPLWAMLMPVLAAAFYAGMQILTRKLGAVSRASAMALYIQVAFLLIGAGFYLLAGDGRYAEGVESEALLFLLRAWQWPSAADWWLFALIGAMGGIVGYALSQAYRMGEPATVASYEYTALALALFWGWAIFGTIPGAQSLVGIALIAAAGLFVFLRERQRAAEADKPDGSV